jgi:hypothetical protein
MEKAIGASAVRYVQPNLLLVPNSRMVPHASIAVARRKLVSPAGVVNSSQK